MVLRRLTDPSGSFCSEYISTVAEKGALVTGATNTPFTLGTIRSFFGRLPVAGCWLRQVKSVSAGKKKIEAKAIRLYRTPDLAGGRNITSAGRCTGIFRPGNWRNYSLSVRVILRVSPPEESTMISPWLRLTTEGNFSP